MRLSVSHGDRMVPTAGSDGFPAASHRFPDVLPMPTLPARAAAYTRTGILERFLDDLAASVPQRVDSDYAERELRLKGGDIRAFLQSLRVLGLIDPYGQVTEPGRRTRALSQRAEVLRGALAQAYPELDQKWSARGGMPRSEVEDFFKVEYGLSTSTAGPAAKLYCDLKRQYGRMAPEPGPEPVLEPGATPPALADSASQPPASPSPAPAPAQDVRLAALDAVKNSLRVEINENWDPERIELVFDRMERLVQLVVGKTVE